MDHQTGVRHHVADTLSRLNTIETADFGVDGDIPIMAVAKSAQKTLREEIRYTPGKTHIKKNNPQLPPFHEFTSTSVPRAKTYIRTKLDPLWEYLGRSLIWTKADSQCGIPL